MKISGKFQKIISFIMIVGVIIPSFLFLPTYKAQAQDNGWYFTIIGTNGAEDIGPSDSQSVCETKLAQAEANGSTVVGICEPVNVGDSTSTSITSGAPPVGSTAAQALTSKGCMQLLGSEYAKLFGKKVVPKIINEAATMTLKANSVPIVSETLETKIDLLDTKTAAIQSSTGYLMKKGGCLDSIAKIIIKNMIGYITTSLINWINNGFEGKPFYLENPESFFKNIAKNEFLNFSNNMKDAKLFPFGRDFIAGAAQAFKGKFEANAQYSLNNVVAKVSPGKLGVDFSTDFNTGGWNAYLGMTAPQNNPVGFSIMASNELSVRLEGTQTSPANQIKESLQQAGGFLGDERCASPVASPVITHAEDAKARNGEKNARKCDRWEYVTPGKLIADKLTNSANSPEKRLEIADDLNSALAALADALISKGVTTLTNEGLKALSKPENNASVAWDSGVTDNLSSGDSGTGTQFSAFYATPGSWISNHPDFNLATDLTQAIVDEQKTYKNKLELYNHALSNDPASYDPTSNDPANGGGLIEWVHQLDYCIPGPNPDWKATSGEILDNGGKFTRNTMWWETDTSKQINSILDPSGISAAIGSALSAKEDQKVAARAVQRILSVNILGADPNDLSQQTQMKSQQDVDTLLHNVFNAYSKKISSIYFSGTKSYMPAVTPEANAEFEKIVGYEKMVENNAKEIIFRQSIITQIESLKQKIDDNQVDPLDPQVINQFARLSAYFIDGDDISNIDNSYKETLDKTKYVRDDLLQGSFGCEKQLEDLWNFGPPNNPESNHKTYLTYVGRQPYTYPIFYLYNYNADPTNHNNRTPWNQSYLALSRDTSPFGGWVTGGTWNVNDGFLPTSTYSNIQGGSGSCPGNLLGTVALSMPDSRKSEWSISSSSDAPFFAIDFGTEGAMSDIGGISANLNPPNSCGVITRGFEKSYNVY